MSKVKKKEKRKCPEKLAPGRGRLFLEENFSQLPSTHDQLKNGHLLLVYHGGDKSPAQTVKAIQEKLHCALDPHRIRPLAEKVQKYEDHLTRQSDMDSYTKVSLTLYTVFFYFLH